MESRYTYQSTYQEAGYTGNILDRAGAKDSKNAATTIKDFVLGHDFVDALQKFDNSNNHDQLVQYFAIVGMDDADALHTAMSVKEMIYCGYGLNEHQMDAKISNHGILTGDRPFIGKTKIFSKSSSSSSAPAATPSGQEEQLPRFRVPKVQPRVLSRVPSIERSKLLFPINLADFVFKDGVQALSARDVEMRHADRDNNGPYDHDSPHIPPFGAYPTPQNDLQREMLYTNQEGKMYYAACFDYFVDLSEIEAELRAQGLFDEYYGIIEKIQREATMDTGDPQAETGEAKEQELKKMEEKYRDLAGILETTIPRKRYYLPFTMCLLSLKSYRTQYLAILEALYRSQAGRGEDNEGSRGGRTFEEAVNSIVFGVPSPPRRFEYFGDYFQKKGSSRDTSSSQGLPIPGGRDQKPFVELCLYPPFKSPDGNYEGKKIYLQNENPFDIANSRYENIWVLLQTLSAENVLQLFKRLLFNTCNILVSEDAATLNKCIQGIIELFYPLSCDLICIPNLPLSMLEYVNMCGQCVLGVVQKAKPKPPPLGHIYRSTVPAHAKDSSGAKRSDTSKVPNKTPRVSLRDDDVVDLFDIMQDNACQMDLDQNHSIQKPRQVVAFNTKGRLAQGQGAAQSSGGRANYSQQSAGQLLKMNQYPQGSGKQGGGPENLNDIELPKDSSRSIKAAIQKAQKDQIKQSQQLEGCLAELAKVQQRRPTSSKQEEEQRKRVAQLEAEIHHSQFAMQTRVREVKYEFYTMIRKVLQAYCYDGKSHGGLPSTLLPEFKGGATQSGHMPKYIRWQARRDIFQLVEKKAFKRDAKTSDGQQLYAQLFYQRLIYYPSLQNFIAEKFFPNSIDDNIRQLHAHPEILVPEDSAPVLPGGRRGGRGANGQQALTKQQLKAKEQKKQKKHEKEQDPNMASGSTSSQSAEINLAAALFGHDMARATAHRHGSPLRCTSSFPRHLDENLVRQDFLKSHNSKLVQSLTRHDVRLAAVLERPGSDLDIAPVVDMKVRVALYFEQLTPKVNIIIAWLFLFLGCLEYQLDPALFTPASAHTPEKELNWPTFKSAAYYESQAKVEQLIAKDFEKVLKMLVYKFNYDFNPRCPLLSLLYQYTHKYGFLHQKLIDVVHQDVDQQQGGGGAGGSMCVSNSFVIYQLHWESRQLRLPEEDERKLKQRLRDDAASELKQLKQRHRKEGTPHIHTNTHRQALKHHAHHSSRTPGGGESGHAESGQTYRQRAQPTADDDNGTQKLLQWAKEAKQGDLAIADPYLLNEKLERKWEYNADRLALLRGLGEADRRENERNGLGHERQGQTLQPDDSAEMTSQKNPSSGGRAPRGTPGRAGVAWLGRLFRRGGDDRGRGSTGGVNSKQAQKELKAAQRERAGRGGDPRGAAAGKYGSKSGKGYESSSKLEGPGAGLHGAHQNSEEAKGSSSSLTDGKAHKNQLNDSKRANLAYFATEEEAYAAGEQEGFENGRMHNDVEEQVQRARSFVSPSILRKARRIGDGVAAGDFQAATNLGLHVELDLVPASGSEMDSETQALLSLKNKKVSRGPGAVAKIKVNAASTTGSFALHQVDLLEPVALRGGVQTILGIDKSYKTLQSLDLSALLAVAEEADPEDKSDKQLYWNLVFWFKFTQLPVRWMAPFLEHLMRDGDLPAADPSLADLGGLVAAAGESELAEGAQAGLSLEQKRFINDPREFWVAQLRMRGDGPERTGASSGLASAEAKQQAKDGAPEAAPAKGPAAHELNVPVKELTKEEKARKARALKAAQSQARRDRRRAAKEKAKRAANTHSNLVSASLSTTTGLPLGVSTSNEEADEAEKEVGGQLAALADAYGMDVQIDDIKR